MNIIILICKIIIVLPLLIQSVKLNKFLEEMKLIENIANKHKLINDKVKPIENGLIKEIDSGFIWLGEFENMKIAIKFIPETKDEFGQARDYGLRECECYEALNSIKNSKITPYGIPCIHFCEKALNDKFYMIGMQLLDPIAEKLGLKPKIDWVSGQNLSDEEAIDIFLQTEFALVQVKYAHSRRVRHNNIKPSCFSIHRFQVFLLGWHHGERSDRIKQNGKSGKTAKYTSRTGFEGEQRSWTDDIENLFNVYIRWSKVIHSWDADIDSNEVRRIRNNKDEMLEHCNQIGHKWLKEFCKEFYELAYEPNSLYPNYNKILAKAVYYRKKTTGSDGPAFFHWLNDTERAEAKKFKMPTIESIPNPPYDGSPPQPIISLVDQDVEFPLHFLDEDRLRLNTMAETGELINGEIKLLGKRQIGTGLTSIVWKARYNGEDIAAKFIPKAHKRFLDIEIENHRAMNAYKNASSEKYGIPNIKYEGTIFNDRIHVIGLTFLESNEEKLNMKNWNHGQAISDTEALNILAFMKYVIIPLKRAHSVKLKHNDLKPDCIRYRGCHVYLTDWNLGEIGDKKSLGTTPLWTSRKGVLLEQRGYKDEVESLYVVSMEYGKINSLWSNIYDKDDEMKIRQNDGAVRAHCDEINHRVLKKYCKTFFDAAYYCPKYPNYNDLFHLPDEFVKEITGSTEPVHFQWLKGKELEDAKAFDWNQLLDSIPNPPHDDSPASSSGSSEFGADDVPPEFRFIFGSGMHVTIAQDAAPSSSTGSSGHREAHRTPSRGSNASKLNATPPKSQSSTGPSIQRSASQDVRPTSSIGSGAHEARPSADVRGECGPNCIRLATGSNAGDTTINRVASNTPSHPQSDANHGVRDDTISSPDKKRAKDRKRKRYIPCCCPM